MHIKSPLDGEMHDHIACGCKLADNCKFVDDDMLGFRNLMLRLHNEIRNGVAAGTDKGPNKDQDYLGPVANMHALTDYDMDLEHSAVCKTTSCVGYHDHCRQTEKYPMAGQNSASWSTNEATIETVKNDMVGAWYHQEIAYLRVSP